MSSPSHRKTSNSLTLTVTLQRRPVSLICAENHAMGVVTFTRGTQMIAVRLRIQRTISCLGAAPLIMFMLGKVPSDMPVVRSVIVFAEALCIFYEYVV